MVLRFGDEQIPIIQFYAVAIGAVQTVGLLDYFASSQGYYGDPAVIELTVIPSESVRPHLQNLHIIWAVTLAVETLWRYQLYHAFTGDIKVFDDIVGTIKYQRDVRSGNQQPQNITLLDGELTSASTLSQSGITNTTTELSNAPPFDIKSIVGGQKLDALSMFVATIRSLTLLAVPDTKAPAEDFSDQDEDTGVQIVVEPVRGYDLLTNGDVTVVIAKIAIGSIIVKSFYEAEATWYISTSDKTPIGNVKVLKYRAPNTHVSGIE